MSERTSIDGDVILHALEDLLVLLLSLSMRDKYPWLLTSPPKKCCKSSSKDFQMPFWMLRHLWGVSRAISLKLPKNGFAALAGVGALLEVSKSARCSVGPPSAKAVLTELRNTSQAALRLCVVFDSSSS